MATFTDIKTRAAQVAAAAQPGENTAKRIGRLFEDIADLAGLAVKSGLALGVASSPTGASLTLTGTTGGGAAVNVSVTLPAVSQSKAGLMTPEQLSALSDLQGTLSSLSSSLTSLGSSLSTLQDRVTQLESDVSLLASSPASASEALLWYDQDVMLGRAPDVVQNTTYAGDDGQILFYAAQKAFYTYSPSQNKYYQGGELSGYINPITKKIRTDRIFICAESKQAWYWDGAAVRVITNQE